MNSSTNEDVQLLTVNYRNAVYQGYFNRHYQSREGIGLIYTTDTNMMIGTFWENDLVNSATLIYYNHFNYMYGFWKDNLPHGFNSIRMDKITFFAFYNMGHIQSHILAIFQQWNLAVILSKNSQNEFEQLSKGDILSDNDFNRFVQQCQWPQFHDQWRTLIKFTLSYLSNESTQKTIYPKLRLINKTFYRYGYNEGLAIIFDDSCQILSLGIHKHTKLTSIGIHYNQDKFVDQGNFSKQNQVFSYNYNHRPQSKLFKVYSTFLLSSNTNFINKFVANPATKAIQYLQQQKRANLFTSILSQQSKNIIQPKQNHSMTIQQQSQQIIQTKKDESKRLKQQKKVLDIYKDEIKRKIRQKHKLSDDRQVKQLTPEHIPLSINNSRVIHKPPVELATLDSTKNKNKQNPTIPIKGKSRSPIFTPQKNKYQKPQISPFRQIMHQKIFQDKEKFHNSHTQYNSPHQQLQFSKLSSHDDPQALPLTWKDKSDFSSQTKFFQLSKPRQSKPDKQQQSMHNTDPQLLKNMSNDRLLHYNNNKPYDQIHNEKGITNTNMANIVIVSQNRNQTPKKTNQQYNKNQPIDQNYKRRNQVYLKPQIKKTPPTTRQPEPALLPKNDKKKQIKQIKGYTYLQRSKQNKQKTPQKYPAMNKQQQKYNQTIKNFNKNNKFYMLAPSQSQQNKKAPTNKQNQKQFIEDSLYNNTNNKEQGKKKKYNYQYYH